MEPRLTLKSAREALCVAELAMDNWLAEDERSRRHQMVVAQLIQIIDLLRPIGPDGRHGSLHTPFCGCDDADRQAVVHACPPEGSGIMPCCGRAPFEVPGTDRITAFGPLVTCAGRLG